MTTEQMYTLIRSRRESSGPVNALDAQCNHLRETDPTFRAFDDSFSKFQSELESYLKWKQMGATQANPHVRPVWPDDIPASYINEMFAYYGLAAN